jgi:hypothetical protein
MIFKTECLDVIFFLPKNEQKWELFLQPFNFPEFQVEVNTKSQKFDKAVKETVALAIFSYRVNFAGEISGQKSI